MKSKKTARELLISYVLDQIVEDVNSGDLTIIKELISKLGDDALRGYLQENA